ncbi:alpha/beta hydrolase [Microbacterium amylolyticum]|uniref:Alpha-beta hydrolase superfamily lysophospholipase n=1 Tax=Microbacterium amylolyticum TaxID=936337 RepID=A0ABS4ZGA0_9MICO|nr:alpha/beta fold hydrolase [Microbacterium amylolyticum]MBP2435496.1 alpha-beta hydrolase superfamily lysophospholipase [Microbacterium amylolyticum]
MSGSRRAVIVRRGWAEAIALGLAAALGVMIGATAVAFTVARRVVTPFTKRLADTEVREIDRDAQTITLTKTTDTVLPGRYGLFVNGSRSYLKLGAVVRKDDTAVTRKLLTHVGPTDLIGRDATFSGWYFDHASQLHLPYEDVEIPSPVGPCPAWYFPAQGGAGSTWVVAVHGRGTTRSEVLRAVPVFRDAGLSTLAISYRNDGEAPPSQSGRYGLGATEWRDVDAAIAYARERGASRVVLMGWSMGGAIALQTALNTDHSDVIAGLILESPVVDWRIVLDHQARALRIPSAVSHLAKRQLTVRSWSRVVRAGDPISLDDLDLVRRADELEQPVLILHSDDDGFVPSGASRALAEARPDLVELDIYSEARHTKLWNYDEARWSNRIRRWLSEKITP